MNSDTLLYRMVHPSWMLEGRPTSQTFKPTRKDNGRLSAYDGDQISPQDAYEHFTSPQPGLGQRAVGVLAITVAECKSFNLTVSPDPLVGFPEHVAIDFTGRSRRGIEVVAGELNDFANARGWQYRPGA